MLASELIKALTGLIEKHGDLPVYCDDEEFGAYEVGFARYVNQPERVEWGTYRYAAVECIMLTEDEIIIPVFRFREVMDEEYTAPDFIAVRHSEEAPPFSFKYAEKIDGQLDIVAFTPEGVEIKTPKGHVVTIPNDSPSTVFGIRDDDEGATVIPH